MARLIVWMPNMDTWILDRFFFDLDRSVFFDTNDTNNVAFIIRCLWLPLQHPRACAVWNGGSDHLRHERSPEGATRPTRSLL